MWKFKFGFRTKTNKNENKQKRKQTKTKMKNKIFEEFKNMRFDEFKIGAENLFNLMYRFEHSDKTQQLKDLLHSALKVAYLRGCHDCQQTFQFVHSEIGECIDDELTKPVIPSAESNVKVN